MPWSGIEEVKFKVNQIRDYYENKSKNYDENFLLMILFNHIKIFGS